MLDLNSIGVTNNTEDERRLQMAFTTFFFFFFRFINSVLFFYMFLRRLEISPPPSVQINCRFVQRLGGRGVMTIPSRGCNQDSPSRGHNYIIPYMVGKLAPN